MGGKKGRWEVGATLETVAIIYLRARPVVLVKKERSEIHHTVCDRRIDDANIIFLKLILFDVLMKPKTSSLRTAGGLNNQTWKE